MTENDGGWTVDEFAATPRRGPCANPSDRLAFPPRVYGTATNDAVADRAGQVQREAERVQREAVRMAGRTVAQLQSRGLNNREIARYLRISPQRVSQIPARQRESAVEEEGVGR